MVYLINMVFSKNLLNCLPHKKIKPEINTMTCSHENKAQLFPDPLILQSVGDGFPK